MAIPFLQHLDLKSSAELRNALLHKTTSGAAVDAEAGIIYDTGSNTVKYYNGSAWISLTSNTNDYVDGASLSGTDLVLTRTGSLSDLTIDLSSLDELVNDTTITIEAGTGLVTGGGFTTNQANAETITIDHADVTRTDGTTAETLPYGGTFTAYTDVTTNAQGHITDVEETIFTMPALVTYGLEIGADGGNGAHINLVPSSGTTQTVTIDGVANQTKITEDVGFDGTIYVGLADDVTIDGLTVNNDVLISGNLEVVGTVTTINETVRIVENNTIEFEGTTDNDFEIKLTGGNPTADQTVALPDATGTVALTSDISDDTITITAGNALDGGGTFTLNGSATEITVDHADTSSTASTNNSNLNVVQDVDVDGYGHVTGLESIDLTAQINTLIDSKINDNSHAVTIPSGAMSSAMLHNLNTNDVIVQLYDETTTENVFADIERVSVNQIRVIFAAQLTNPVRVLISKVTAKPGL